MTTRRSFLETLAAGSECSALTVLTNEELRPRLKLPPGVKVRINDLPVRNKLGRIWWDQIALYSAARTAGNDWLFLPKGRAVRGKGGGEIPRHTTSRLGGYFKCPLKRTRPLPTMWDTAALR